MRQTRRDLLRSLAAVAAFARPAEGRRAGRRRVVILGGGMAGVALAWLLDSRYDVTLLEAGAVIGGNVQSVDVEIGGQVYTVDVGAQFFHPGPYPLYTTLLAALGLYPPQPGAPAGAHAFSASITLSADAEPLPRFVSPDLPDRAWPLFTGWNVPGLVAFGTAFAAAKRREQARGRWGLTLGEWLPTIGLKREQWEGMILPWAASLFSGDIEQARGMSARAAMLFAAKALPANPLAPVRYYTMRPGMGEVLRRLIGQLTTSQVFTNARVRHVLRDAQNQFHIGCTDGRGLVADEVVFAASGPSTLQLLEGVPGTALERDALRRIEFHSARLAVHADPAYVPPAPGLWSFLNCRIDGAFCEASMWMASVVGDGPGSPAAGLWKSWTTHRVEPAQVFHEAAFMHMLPTPATIAGQVALHALQGRSGMWYAGGYLFPYDSQETALWSAVEIALGLGGSSRAATLLAQPSVDAEQMAGLRDEAED
jgi:predicted NAD/FAD-binding protein